LRPWNGLYGRRAVDAALAPVDDEDPASPPEGEKTGPLLIRCALYGADLR